jgi:hypothetical protein
LKINHGGRNGGRSFLSVSPVSHSQSPLRGVTVTDWFCWTSQEQSKSAMTAFDWNDWNRPERLMRRGSSLRPTSVVERLKCPARLTGCVTASDGRFQNQSCPDDWKLPFETAPGSACRDRSGLAYQRGRADLHSARSALGRSAARGRAANPALAPCTEAPGCHFGYQTPPLPP